MSRLCIISPVGKYGTFKTWFSKDYDIYLLNYDDSLPDFYPEYPNIRILKGAGFKWQLFSKAIKTGFFDPENYDYILQSDNDIIMSPDQINRIFELTEKNKLDISSPAYKEVGISHWWYMHANGIGGVVLHDTLEQVTTCFSLKAFLIASEWFDLIPDHGWGLEETWKKYINNGANIAVLHDVVIEQAYEEYNTEQQPDNIYKVLGKTPQECDLEQEEFFKKYRLRND